MTTTRTADAISRQIDGLLAERQSLPRRSVFGDNNWARIDAQLSVLRGEELADDYLIDETSDEYEDGDGDIYEAASDAQDWLWGRSNEDLFET